MSSLILILSVIAGIFILVLLAAFIQSRELNLEKNVIINRNCTAVFDFLKFLKNHDEFNVWQRTDPAMKKVYKGIDGEVGFVYCWDSTASKNVGAGEQEIKAIEQNKQIEFEIRFKRPMEDTAKAFMHFKQEGAERTMISWQFRSNMKFPMNALKPLFKNMLGKDMEKSLVTLKNHLEK